MPRNDDDHIDKLGRGLLTGILLALVSLGIPGLFRLGGLTENVESLNKQMFKITGQIEHLIRDDFESLKDDFSSLDKRLLSIEDKGILPAADARLKKIEADMEQIKYKLRIEPAQVLDELKNIKNRLAEEGKSD